jgi:ABC-type multidrug transport system ATPase subunit
LTVNQGDLFGFIGSNGAGKTTTLRILATFLAPSAGTAKILGHDVVREADAVRRDISLTGQFAALEANLTARENLVLMARLRGHGRREAAKVAGSLIERYDIGEFRDKLIKNVSGGQRRRVDLAASLVTRPQLVVLDEPTTGLDPRSRQVVWATVHDLVAEGVTLVLTTQYLEEADELADQIVFIDHGKAVAAGTPAELRAQIGDHRVDVVVSDQGNFDRLAALLGQSFELTLAPGRRTVSVPAPRQAFDLASVTSAVVAAGVAVDEVALRRPTLDDAFLALTGEPGAAIDDLEVVA